MLVKITQIITFRPPIFIVFQILKLMLCSNQTVIIKLIIKTVCCSLTILWRGIYSMSHSESGRLFNWIFFLIFTFGLIFAIVALTVEIPKLFENNEEKVIDELYTVKGMYYGPTYYVKFSDGNNHRVSKKDFVQLEEGDTYKVFFNNVSLRDFLIFALIGLVGLYILVLCTYIFAWEALVHKKWFNKIMHPIERMRKFFKSILQKNKHRRDKQKRLLNLVLIVLCLIAPLSIIKNTVHKLNPFGKTNVEAKIIDQEIYRHHGFRVASSAYTITYEYVDENGNAYQTKKNVSRQTYKRYENEHAIPIVYRDHHPYDTFIVNQTFNEYVSFIVNVRNLAILVSTWLAFFFIKQYRKNSLSVRS